MVYVIYYKKIIILHISISFYNLIHFITRFLDLNINIIYFFNFKRSYHKINAILFNFKVLVLGYGPHDKMLLL